MRTALILLLPTLGACKVVDAPENLEELMVFGFEHFDDDDSLLIDMVDQLEPLVEAQDGALAEGYRINTLTAEHLESVGIADPNLDNVVGALGQADYLHGLDDVTFAVSLPNKADVYETYQAYEVVEDTDLACFLDGDCNDYTLTIEQTVHVSLLGDATQQIDQVYRRVTSDDGESFIISRILSPTGVEFNSNIVAIDQQYQLFVMYPNGAGTRRVEAFWVEARFIGIDIPDSVAVDNFAKSVGDQAVRIDEFLDTQ